MRKATFLVALLGALAKNVRAADPTAKISDGTIVGTTTNIPGPSNSPVIVNKYLGIPYAAPPTKDNRFKPPQSPQKWESKDTKVYGPSCRQVVSGAASDVFNNPPPDKEDEDCLYLNVYGPANQTPNEKYPVMYWIYGGGWMFGNAAHPWYDGSHFAALENVIVVTMNYRMNMFGFPMTPAIPTEERNLGMLDQRAGLAWIQANIDQFGGDKSKVTLFGQSAGGYAVDAILTSYDKDAELPFHAAIMESGVSAFLAGTNCSDAPGFSVWDTAAAALGCNDSDATAKLNCVKGKSADDIIKVQTTSPGFACDGKTQVKDPRNRLMAGNVAKVPVMLGTNTQDGSFYTHFYKMNFSQYWFFQGPGFSDPKFQQDILNEYPVGQEGRDDDQLRMAQIHTDWFFHCPGVYYAEYSSKIKPTYRYLYNAVWDNMRANTSDWQYSPIDYQGAYHASEIPLAFTSYKPTSDAAENRLSDTMRKAWAGFARDPSKAPIEGWPTADGRDEQQSVMMFGSNRKDEFKVVKDDLAHHCDFWEAKNFKWSHA